MKTIYNQFLILFIVFTTIISCKAQTLPLNTDLDNTPLNAYLKDLNNELDPYVGTYQATIDGNQINLFITKEDHKYFDLGDVKFFQDVLIVRYTIKNSAGVILQSTQNTNFVTMKEKNLIHSLGTNPNLGMAILTYNGTNCDIGWGSVYLKKLNATQISWRYYAETVATSHERCPPNVDKSTYLPEGENLIFTKQ
ncbi:hypothetical protein MUU74_01785 [Chryseobacterium daecheongense]|uniref:DUF6705 family protein n=1 Tax=Chryseobacterium daecheongense TaxID=192389 RepID=UPI001FD692C3|nr:DUF6705 family protein [Chryseobacterium daecheongense]UOU98698.1 hypothetical protein MUU74_01785 [Chryseobacterium daecheongense]